MTFYRPRFRTQLDGSRCAGYNCVPTSFAMAWDRDRRGVDPKKVAGAPWPPTPAYVVAEVYDGATCRAINSGEANTVGKASYGVNLAHYTRLPIGDARTLSLAGHGIACTIRYSALRGTPQDSSGTFSTNHKVFLQEINAAKTHGLVYDPLANGRFLSALGRNALAGPQWWPLDLLWKAAGLVWLSLDGTSKVGAGFVYCDVTRDTEPEEEELEMFPVVEATILPAPNPRAFTTRAGTTLRGYDPAKPGVVVKSAAITTPSTGHADAEVGVTWENLAAGQVAPIPRGFPFLRVIDGTFAGLLIVEALVDVEAATPAVPPDDAALTAAYNAGVDAAAGAAAQQKKGG